MSPKKKDEFKIKDEPKTRYTSSLVEPYNYSTDEMSIELRRVTIDVLKTEVVRRKKSLFQILDEYDDNIRAAAEASRQAELASRAAKEAAVQATQASMQAEKRAEEARQAGQMAAEIATKAAANASRKAEQTAKAGRLAAAAAAKKAEAADASAKAAVESFRKAAEGSVLAVVKEIKEAKKVSRSLKKENVSLLGRIKSLEERLGIIETALPTEKVIVLREISKKEAEKEICNLFSKGDTLYYSDIAERLNLDLQMVVDICNGLQKRGEIKVDDNALQSR